jgi:hypothetical protein
LAAHKADLELPRIRSETVEDDLVEVSGRLARLENRIDQASFGERRRAVEELVKEIQVEFHTADGKTMPIFTTIFRFSEPSRPVIPPPIAIVIDHTVRDS